MNSETEIVLSLLRSIKNQMQVGNSAESSLTYQHPNFGELVFEMRIEDLLNPKFEKDTIALVFSINKCRSRLTVGQKEKIQIEVERYLENPNSIIEDIPNYYRMLFE